MQRPNFQITDNGLELKVAILAAVWTIRVIKREKDPILAQDDCNGYCDWTTRRIVVVDFLADDENEHGNPERITEKVLRHEIIHAFLFESGLAYKFEHPETGHDEQYVDWFAIQSPKIFRVFSELDLLGEYA